MVLENWLRLETGLPEEYRQMSEEEMAERVRAVKGRFGRRLFIPGHHYQKDEVIRLADATGDSLQLAKLAAENDNAEYIVFCGVHFMAETADILTGEHQIVILPDLRAGCSMADMAELRQLERAWEQLTDWFGDTVLPLTYVNSKAEIKAFCGRKGGATVTSSNAAMMLSWALSQKERVLFLPDQHLGRNTAYRLGVPLSRMAVWDPVEERLEYEGDLADVRVILWKGHCSVHEKFTVAQIRAWRRRYPDIRVIVHPECTFEVVQEADEVGSTSYIIQTLAAAPAGSRWAVGTEMNLVNRLSRMHPDKTIVSLNPTMCPCLTMNRIDLPHLTWALDRLVAGEVVNCIRVDAAVAADAKRAIERMFLQCR
ncbi:MAG: quinolinate synthetase [Bacillaceae bacterium G1]|nr:quinolinate synthase [Bacillota bacterium]OJF17377.1 MAG: quinolinate synthetase [Bacillaceae bacterium G1]